MKNIPLFRKENSVLSDIVLVSGYMHAFNGKNDTLMKQFPYNLTSFSRHVR
ncbi:MAG: hypothetical protein WBG45_15965 [Paenisporosarcina sp.]